MNSSSAYSAERGAAALAFVLLLAVPLLFVFGGAFVATVMQAATVNAGLAEDGISDQTSSMLEAPAGPAPAIPLEGGLGTGGLVEVRLPGITAPKVPALDRRVAPLVYGTLKALAKQGVHHVTFTYLFRTTQQQQDVQPVGTTMKARPGTSDHEAGTAVDIAGMRSRSDAGKIVAAFRASGFSWLGPRDAAHFFIPASQLGEADKYAFIKRQQRHYESGLWRQP